MEKILLVGAGGALGAMLRYLVSLLPFRGDFPLATLLVNVLGAVAIGFITGLTLSRNPPGDGMVLFLKTGLCGGFTTFSTFSLEALNLMQEGQWWQAIVYMVASCVLSVLAALLGSYLGNRV